MSVDHEGRSVDHTRHQEADESQPGCLGEDVGKPETRLPCDDYTIIITLVTRKPRATAPRTVYLRSHQPLDNFIMGNKQPGSRPSLVKYVNSSVRHRVNKTFWHRDIKLKY